MGVTRIHWSSGKEFLKNTSSKFHQWEECRFHPVMNHKEARWLPCIWLQVRPYRKSDHDAAISLFVMAQSSSGTLGPFDFFKPSGLFCLTRWLWLWKRLDYPFWLLQGSKTHFLKLLDFQLLEHKPFGIFSPSGARHFFKDGSRNIGHTTTWLTRKDEEIFVKKWGTGRRVARSGRKRRYGLLQPKAFLQDFWKRSKSYMEDSLVCEVL